MSPQLIVINTDHEALLLLKKLKQEEISFISYDTETTGLYYGATVIGFSFCYTEDKAYYIIHKSYNSTTKQLDTNVDFEICQQYLDFISTKSIIMHNAVFDCDKTNIYFKKELIQSVHTDTMILAHLINENESIALKELGKRVLKLKADKEQIEMKESIYNNGGEITKKNYELYKADAQLIGKYGAKDAWLTYMLFLELVPKLYEEKLEKFFYEDESMPLLKGPTYEMNTTGFSVDSKKVAKLYSELLTESAECLSFVEKEIAHLIKDEYPGTNKKNTFKVTSSQQLSWLLFGKMQLDFKSLTKGGKTFCKDLSIKPPYTKAAKNDFINTCLQLQGKMYSEPVNNLITGKKTAGKKVKSPWAYIMCDKKTLSFYKDKYKWIEKLLLYQKNQKLLKTYVKALKDKTLYGVIRPSFKQAGTTSGRYSSTEPNFQNLPRDDKRIKECIIARPNCVFVGADQSQLEPRVFTYYSQDPNLIESFNGDTDFYSVIGMRVYQKYDCTPYKDGTPDAFGIKYKKLRDLSKVIALASTYGATAYQLKDTTNKSIDETQQDINDYFEAFPNVKKMMEEAHELVKKKGYVENIFGRKRRIPEALDIDKHYKNLDHDDLPYYYRTLLNLAVNHRIQSTGASIVNRSMINFHNWSKLQSFYCKIVVQVHDSIVVECDEQYKQLVADKLQQCMTEFNPLKVIPLEAIPQIGYNLAQV